MICCASPLFRMPNPPLHTEIFKDLIDTDDRMEPGKTDLHGSRGV